MKPPQKLKAAVPRIRPAAANKRRPVDKLRRRIYIDYQSARLGGRP